MHHCAAPPAVDESSHFPVTSPALGVVNIFNYFSECVVVSHLDLICIPLMANCIKLLVMCLFVIHIPSLAKYQLKLFIHFLIGLFVFCLLS